MKILRIVNGHLLSDDQSFAVKMLAQEDVEKLIVSAIPEAC